MPPGRFWPFFLVACGLGLIAWVVGSKGFLDAAGFPTAQGLLPVSAGLGVVLLSLTMRTPVASAAAWGTLLLVGQAAGLRLIDAGTALHYQHFRPWSDAWATEPFATLVVGAQILIVIAGLARIRRDLLGWIRRVLGWRRAALLAVAVVLSSATLSEDPIRYLAELPFATVVQAAALATTVLAAASLPREVTGLLSAGLDRTLGLDEAAGRPRADRFVIVPAMAVTLVAAVLCVVVYERHPHVQDEVKYLYQARYYAEGLIAMPPPPAPDAFELSLLEVGPRGWYSVIPPGWPLVLAAGQLAGAPWLVNPALSGLNIVLVYLILWRLYGRRIARLAVVLLSLSPWYLYLGMSFMPHMVTLTCLCVGTLAVMHARETGAWYPTWIGGSAVGFLSLVRQLDGFVVALLLGLWSVGVGGRRLRVGSIAGFLVSTGLIAGLTLPYNQYFTGTATRFPIMAHHDRLFGVNSNAYGFGPDRGLGWELDPFPGHGVRDAFVNANLNITSMNVELFGWATGSLIFVYFLVVRGGFGRGDRLLLTLSVAVFVAYFFNYFSGGPDFGARYWFLMIVPAAVLTVRGMWALAASLAEPPGHATARVTMAALTLSVVALVSFVPWRALDKYHHYQRMRPDLRRLAAEYGFGESLVFVRGPEFPDYASAAAYNPVDLNASAPVYVRDRGQASRERLRAAFRDRPIWVVDGPSRTGAGYRVAAGPLTWTRFAEDPGLR